MSRPERGGSPSDPLLTSVVGKLVDDLTRGAGDGEQRRQVEEWLCALAEKYPELGIESGLRDYYLAEAGRLVGKFESTQDLVERLNLGRSVETFLEKAAEVRRRSEPSEP